jgi:hypothetical protein
MIVQMAGYAFRLRSLSYGGQVGSNPPYWLRADREDSSECANVCFIGATSITLSPCTAAIALGLKVVKNARNIRATTTTIPRLATSFTTLLSS